MSATLRLKQQTPAHRQLTIGLVSLLVGLNGLFILATSLLDQLNIRHAVHLSDIVIDLPLLIGLGLIYLSVLLRRRKRTAWLVTVIAYAFYLGLEASIILNRQSLHGVDLLDLVRRLVIPMAIVGILLVMQKDFVVRSDVQGFRLAARFSIIMLLVALLYGIVGFTLMDSSDFHQEISPRNAVYDTVSQFDLTTTSVHAYTRRAHIFLGSLTVVSLAAVGYAVISLFQPLRFSLTDQGAARRRMEDLLMDAKAPSEEFFKLWPHDKQYVFDQSGESGLAFHAARGVALCLSDPVGNANRFGDLLDDFQDHCYGNDWLPAFIHVENRHRLLYESRGFSLQKLGQEAVVEIGHFQAAVAKNKYFRHIRNKFTKQGFSCELLLPPHATEVMQRLQTVSEEWLGVGGRVERGFVMGYYQPEYIQQCPIMVVKDDQGVIQAFLNQIPAAFDTEEATFDMLRHTTGSIGNINDFLLLGFISALEEAGYTRLNLGFCPLVGLKDTDTDKKGLIDGVLRFAYANGDRFYSFSGLHRFKAKYEPEWHDRYMAYQGGVRGFSRTTTALVGAMRVKK